VKDPKELVLLRAPGVRTGHIWSDGDDSELFPIRFTKASRQQSGVCRDIRAVCVFRKYREAAGKRNEGRVNSLLEITLKCWACSRPWAACFSQEDDRVPGAHPVAVLSNAYWLRQFGGDPGVLNQTLLVNNTEMTVVGVAQAGFAGVQVGQSTDVFVPTMMKGQMTPIRSGLDDWNDYWMAFSREKSRAFHGAGRSRD